MRFKEKKEEKDRTRDRDITRTLKGFRDGKPGENGKQTVAGLAKFHAGVYFEEHVLFKAESFV